MEDERVAKRSKSEVDLDVIIETAKSTHPHVQLKKSEDGRLLRRLYGSTWRTVCARHLVKECKRTECLAWRDELTARILEWNKTYPNDEFKITKNQRIGKKRTNQQWIAVCLSHCRFLVDCRECGGKGHCKHDIQKHRCRDPSCGGGAAYCKHDILKSYCRDPDCGGGTVYCKHDIQKTYCRDPECGGGTAYCKHDIQKKYCRDPECGGGTAYCKHDIQKKYCRDTECGGGTAYCKHDIQKHRCRDPLCGGGAAYCKHDIRKTHCRDPECGGGTVYCKSCSQKHAKKDGFCIKCHPDYIETKSGASKVACKFMDDYERHHNQSVQHIHYDFATKCCTGDEHRPEAWKQKPVDGYFVDADGTPTVIEFLGDVFHGHPRLWEHDDTARNHYGKSFKHLFEKTQHNLQKLIDNGYTVKYVWEHDYPPRALQSVDTVVRLFEGVLEY